VAEQVQVSGSLAAGRLSPLIPAQAGIQCWLCLDPRFRGDERKG
jgi:hypothetical protein